MKKVNKLYELQFFVSVVMPNNCIDYDVLCFYSFGSNVDEAVFNLTNNKFLFLKLLACQHNVYLCDFELEDFKWSNLVDFIIHKINAYPCDIRKFKCV